MQGGWLVLGSTRFGRDWGDSAEAGSRRRSKTGASLSIATQLSLSSVSGLAF